MILLETTDNITASLVASDLLCTIGNVVVYLVKLPGSLNTHVMLL